MTDKEKIEELTSELRFTIKALKGIHTNYEMDVMASNLLSTRIINLEAKLKRFESREELDRIKTLCA